MSPKENKKIAEYPTAVAPPDGEMLGWELEAVEAVEDKEDEEDEEEVVDFAALEELLLLFALQISGVFWVDPDADPAVKKTAVAEGRSSSSSRKRSINTVQTRDGLSNTESNT